MALDSTMSLISVIEVILEETGINCGKFGFLKGKIIAVEMSDNTIQCVEWYLSISQNRDSTIRNRQITLNKYVTPVLGDIPVRKITPAMLSKLFADLYSGGSKKTTYTPTADFVNVIKADSAGKIAATAPLAAKTVDHIANSISTIYTKLINKDKQGKEVIGLTTIALTSWQQTQREI
jgi:hypothetical protein